MSGIVRNYSWYHTPHGSVVLASFRVVRPEAAPVWSHFPLPSAMLKLVALALLVVAAIAAPQCGCEDTIAALEKRVAFLESRLDGVVGNSKF